MRRRYNGVPQEHIASKGYIAREAYIAFAQQNNKRNSNYEHKTQSFPCRFD